MATSVQIELLVDEKGAVTGIRAFDTAAKGATGTVQKLGQELANAGRQSEGIKQAGRAAREVGGHFQTSLDSVRLFRQELGVHVPRAMETIISRMPVLMRGINALNSAMVGFGFGMIAISAAKEAVDGLENVWNHFQLVTKASQDYQAEVAKTQQQEFGNSHSIETTRMRIDEATEAVREFHRQAEAAPKQLTGWRSLVPGLGPAWQAWHNQDVAGGLEGQAYDKQRQIDRLNNVQESAQFHEGVVGRIEAQHAGDEALRGQKRITAEYQYRRDLAAETRRYENEQDRLNGNPVAPNAGSQEESNANAKARREMQAQEAIEGREQAQELAHIKEQALESGLRGVALYKAQEAAAIEDLKFKDMNSTAARNAIHLRFHNEEMKRLEDEGRETAKIQREAGMAGMTGIGRIQMEGANRVADINEDPNLSPNAKAARVKAAEQETNAQILEAQQAFAEQVDAISQQSQSKQLSGFARIRAEAQKAAEDLQRQFDKAHNLMDLARPGAQSQLDQDTAQLGRGLSAIQDGADRESDELAWHNSQETLQIEEDARVRSLRAERQKTASIEAEYEKRVQLYQEQLRQKEIREDDFNRRVRAAAEERDAEMVESSREAHQKMAEQFDSFFKSLDHPLKALENLGDKVAGNAAASLVQYIQGRGKGTPGADAGDGQGGLLSIFTGFGFGKKKAPGVDAETGHGFSHAASEKTFQVGQAVIRVGSAIFSGGGGGGGFSSAGWSGDGGATLPAGGSTVLGWGLGGYAGASAPATASSAIAGRSWGDTAASSGEWGTSSRGTIGGAGDSSVPGVPASSFAAGSGTSGQSQSRVGGLLGNVQQGWGLAKGLRGIFKSGSSSKSSNPFGAGGDGSTDASDDPLSAGGDAGSGASSTNGGMLGGGGFAANATGAIGGAVGVYSAVEGNGGVGGALGGAMSGMQLGMALGGPVGAAVGAAAGAIVGAIGFGGREKARVYDLKNVRPRLTADQDAYAQGTMDYMSAYSDVQGMIGSSWGAIRSMGPAAMSYWNDTIKPELTQAMGKFTAEQRGGRSMYTAQQASYAVGTDYVPYDQTAQIHKGESIYTAERTERATRALESGADLSRIHDSYQQAMRSSSARQPGGGDRTLNISVHAMDSRGVTQFFDQYKHHLRAAVDDSYGENSGGGRN